MHNIDNPVFSAKPLSILSIRVWAIWLKELKFIQFVKKPQVITNFEFINWSPMSEKKI